MINDESYANGGITNTIVSEYIWVSVLYNFFCSLNINFISLLAVECKEFLSQLLFKELMDRGEGAGKIRKTN